ncbi:hypothetical protein BDY21DRAFT_113178 [Lineolata rhizophorae]|uniref:Uncharacterized protein n=1 Tax=Lineolata rhizophorae TaxID=578093 RepID=A0A6A6NRF0_9PEZI|nr:hypothetical protein BDY21DRAFT_113178 [Lineolata rhizophorae]
MARQNTPKTTSSCQHYPDHRRAVTPFQSEWTAHYKIWPIPSKTIVCRIPVMASSLPSRWTYPASISSSWLRGVLLGGDFNRLYFGPIHRNLFAARIRLEIGEEDSAAEDIEVAISGPGYTIIACNCLSEGFGRTNLLAFTMLHSTKSNNEIRKVVFKLLLRVETWQMSQWMGEHHLLLCIAFTRGGYFAIAL